MSSIESLSKRIQPKLTCRVIREDVAMTTDNYYRVVRRFKLYDWTNMSPAVVTAKVIDPALESIADLVNGWNEIKSAPLPQSEDDEVVSFVSEDGDLPIRMLISPAGDEIVVVFDILIETT